MMEKLNVADINWEYAREVVASEKPAWEEEFDEAEGDFIGWILKKSGNVVSFDKFERWWSHRMEQFKGRICSYCQRPLVDKRQKYCNKRCAKNYKIRVRT